MIRFLAILSLVIVVLLSLAACGEEADPTAAPAAAPIAPAAPAAVVEVVTLPPSMTGQIPAATPVPPESRPTAIAAIGTVQVHADSAGQVPEGITVSATTSAITTPASASEAAMMALSTPAPTAAAAPAPTSRTTGTPTPAPAPQAQGTPSATTFQDYLRERFVSTAADAVSTFSLDTDRTSYYLALNWAREGYAVDPDSVRAEEWINAFNYNYAPPLRDDSFAITGDVFRHPLDSRMHMARFAFQTPEANYDATPVNVTLVLDASGSMNSGDRVSIAREAADAIRNSLRSQDRIAVVQFSSDVLHQFTVQHSDPNDPDVTRSISRLTGRNSTNVQAGLNLGVQLADQARRASPDAYNYIILMSDGVANVDATDPFAILESAGDYDSSNPLRLITIGVGIENYNDYLLEQLAQHGNGWYRYLSDVNQARATFARENWLALSVPFADQTRAQVTWDPSVVASWRIVGYENRITSDESFTQAHREFAEIPSGAATTVFYELELKNPPVGISTRLGSVELRWVTPGTGDSNRQHASILSQGETQFAALNDPLLKLGSVIALAADRYSSLPFADAYESSAHESLLYLSEQLQSLEGPLGNLGAYQDLSFLMDHITQNSRESLRPSGYSP